MSEEQQRIQKYIIKSAPYGQLPDVIKELNKIAPIEMDPPSPAIAAALSDYNDEHFALFVKPDSNDIFMATTASKVAPCRYLDQLTAKVFTVDHFKTRIINSQDYSVELPEPVHNLLQILSGSLRQYTAKYFKEPFGSAVFMQVQEDQLSIHLGFTGKNVQLNNFYTGEWISKWRINKQTIEGEVHVRAHFFEGGNVQFQQKKVLNKPFQFTGNMEDNAKAIMKEIEMFQCQVQDSLTEVYEEMPNEFFKHLRRVATIHKTKMNWNINAYQMNRNIIGEAGHK